MPYFFCIRIFSGFVNYFFILDIFKNVQFAKEAINIGLVFFEKRVLLEDGLVFIIMRKYL
jgi:hypothetical protein